MTPTSGSPSGMGSCSTLRLLREEALGSLIDDSCSTRQAGPRRECAQAMTTGRARRTACAGAGRNTGRRRADANPLSVQAHTSAIALPRHHRGAARKGAPRLSLRYRYRKTLSDREATSTSCGGTFLRQLLGKQIRNRLGDRLRTAPDDRSDPRDGLSDDESNQQPGRAVDDTGLRRRLGQPALRERLSGQRHIQGGSARRCSSATASSA
jgi:hypothetical protein